MTRSQYRADNSRKGMGGFILKDPKLQAAMLDVANDGKAHAVETSPVDTGDYQSSHHVSDDSDRSDSVGATIYNDSQHAALVEYERGDTLAHTADYLNQKMRRRG